MTAAAPVPEAVPLSEYWAEALCFAQLCTLTPEDGGRLAADAFDRGLDQAPGAMDPAFVPGLPALPLLLTAVRDTAADWQARGEGDSLQPEFRIWLNAERAARRGRATRPEPPALRGLRHMTEPDAALLWFTEVECRPTAATARALGVDVTAAQREIDRARDDFRDRCLRSHQEEPPSEECQGYAGLLDAASRMPDEAAPEDLRRHLGRCADCARTAVCLAPHGGALGEALAEGVLGWAGPAYLEARRRAAGQAAVAPPRSRRAARTSRSSRTARSRNRVPGGRGAVAAAVALLAAVVCLTVLVTADDSAPQSAEAAPTAQGGKDGAAPGGPGFPPLPTPGASGAPDAPGDARFPEEIEPSAAEHTIPAADGDASDDAGTGGSAKPPHHATENPAPSCTIAYDVVEQWYDGFQATVTLTSRVDLRDWTVGWTYSDGRRVTQMWDADFSQRGGTVTARAKEYNRTVRAGDSVTFGLVGTRQGTASAPTAFTLDGARCDS
ncbi:cellulose-binding domain-containing protein [Streptomyces sp. NPDC026673]|uniref:cellulose-binding domain-containing protein n=1 Tax=Streptomyces sp. NPDC026673 TaxID=3155724 RepID=UPI0033FA82A1